MIQWASWTAVSSWRARRPKGILGPQRTGATRHSCTIRLHALYLPKQLIIVATNKPFSSSSRQQLGSKKKPVQADPSPNPLALSPLDDALAYRIYRVSRLLRQHLGQVLQDLHLDLSAEQYFLLYRLTQQPGCSQQALADPILGDYPNITRLLDALEKKGFVQREPDPDDRRRHRIHLSKKGTSAMQKAAASIPATRESLFGQLSPSRVQALSKALDSIQQQLLALRPKP